MSNKATLRPPWKKGQSGNPKGNPVGTRHYKVLFREAIRKLAELDGKDPGEIELSIVKKGIQKAVGGDFRFYDDVLTRLHGRAGNDAFDGYEKEIGLLDLLRDAKIKLPPPPGS